MRASHDAKWAKRILAQHANKPVPNVQPTVADLVRTPDKQWSMVSLRTLPAKICNYAAQLLQRCFAKKLKMRSTHAPSLASAQRPKARRSSGTQQQAVYARHWATYSRKMRYPGHFFGAEWSNCLMKRSSAAEGPSSVPRRNRDASNISLAMPQFPA